MIKLGTLVRLDWMFPLSTVGNWKKRKYEIASRNSSQSQLLNPVSITEILTVLSNSRPHVESSNTRSGRHKYGYPLRKGVIHTCVYLSLVALCIFYFNIKWFNLCMKAPG